MTDAETEPDEEPARLPDLEAIIPEPGTILIGDVVCTVNRIRTREMLALLKILTRSMGVLFAPIMQEIDWDDEDAARGGLMGMFVGAMPEVPDETIAFVRAVVSPQLDSASGPAAEALVEFNATMANPDMDVLVDVVGKVVEQEWADLSTLVGKVRALVKTMAPMSKTNTSAKKKSPGGRSGRGRPRST